MNTEPTPPNADILLEISTRAQLDALFKEGASVTAGAPTEVKFLVDRKTHRAYFLPLRFDFHFDFYKEVLNGPLDNADFDEAAYNRPDRTFIAGTVTAYDSYLDPSTAKRGQLCFSLWPTDRFDAALLKETRDAVLAGLTFLTSGEDLAFRPGGPKQERLVEAQTAELQAAGIVVKSNLEISRGIQFMALSQGDAFGRLVIIERGAALPALRRTDVALFLGDVPPTAPPLAAIATTEVQTFNSHLGIKYRQDKTPYFYKAFTDVELTALRALAGKPVAVHANGRDGTIEAATQAEVDAYIEEIKPKQRIRLSPNLTEVRVRSFSDLAEISVKDGKWSREVLAAYGRKTLGVVQLSWMARSGKLNVAGAGEPRVVAPIEPMGVPASFYTRFVQQATDKHGAPLAERMRELVADARFQGDEDWKGKELERLRKAIQKAEMPAAILQELEEQLAIPYLATHPGDLHARLRSSAPVVEDSGGAGVTLPNMAGAFDSHSAKWESGASPAETAKNAARAIAEALQKDYAAVWNDRAVSELLWNNVDLDEASVAMAVLVMPNEDGEKANGVVRVNRDLAGFFSVTGETQLGENLVTNPEAGATPDTWIDGDYDVLDGQVNQDIEYERVSNQISNDPARPHCYTDPEISVVYKAMKVVRAHFAALEGKAREDYVDECETKVLKDGTVQLKQERPWVE
jgi:hypothetical protein